MPTTRKIYMSDLATIDPNICPSSLETDNEGVPLLPFKGQPHVWNETSNPITCAECGTEQDEYNS